MQHVVLNIVLHVVVTAEVIVLWYKLINVSFSTLKRKIENGKRRFNPAWIALFDVPVSDVNMETMNKHCF